MIDINHLYFELFLTSIIAIFAVRASTKIFVMALIFAIALSVGKSLLLGDYLFSYELLFFESIDILAMLVVALFVHLYVAKLKNRLSLTEENNKKMERSSDKLLLKLENSEKNRKLLEKKILKDESFALKIQDSISALSSLESHKIEERLLGLTVDFIRAKSCSFYIFKGESFYLVSSKNLSKPAPHRIDSKNEIYKRALLDDCVTAAEVPNSDILVFNMLKEKSGAIIGAIAIHDIEFLDLNSSNLSLFSMLCHWASVSLERAIIYESQLKESHKYKGSSLFNFKYFGEILIKQMGLAERYNTHFSVLTIKIKGIQDIQPNELKLVVEILGIKLKRLIRDVDSLYFNEQTKDRFHALLPMTNLAGVESLSKKVMDSIDKLTLTPYKNSNDKIAVESTLLFMGSKANLMNINEFLKANS